MAKVQKGTVKYGTSAHVPKVNWTRLAKGVYTEEQQAEQLVGLATSLDMHMYYLHRIGKQSKMQR